MSAAEDALAWALKANGIDGWEREHCFDRLERDCECREHYWREERQAACGPLPARVRVGATTEPARVLRDGDRIWIDTDRDGRYDPGEPVLVVEEE